MIVGSGMLAASLAEAYSSSSRVVIHAAGVSNSACTDQKEFERERALLTNVLAQCRDAETFVYFSTCSMMDPDQRDSAYVSHKQAMERLISAHPGFLIFRLPQVAGRSSNPHTLLNFLHRKISCGQHFTIWGNATRNVIDVDDVAKVVRYVVDNQIYLRQALTVANSRSCTVRDIVTGLESVCGKSAHYDIIDKGSRFAIDVSHIERHLGSANVRFHANYLYEVLQKYYGH